MDIEQFRAVLTSFADEPADVDIRRGRVVAQLREELVDVELKLDSEDGRLLIREHDVSSSARNWLLNRVARLPQLADRILASVPELTSPSTPFVTPSGKMSADLSSPTLVDTAVPDAIATLVDIASHPVPGATSVVYLTSDAGEGKTTLINRASREQAGRFKSKQSSSLIVPIPLSGRAFLTFDDAVIAALVNKLRFNYFYYDAFLHLVRLGAIVPAFDGYEEMLVEGSKGEAVSALGNLVQTLSSSGVVIIAARKAFFEYVSFKTQARFLDAIGDRSAEFSRLELNRWDRDKFIEYGSKRGIDDPNGVYETVAARLGDDHPLLTRAVLVRRLFDVVSDAGDRNELAALLGNNPHDYFYTFVDAIIKREASEKWLARVSGEVMEPLLEQPEHHLLLAQIASEMWQTSSNSLRFDILDVIVELFCESRGKAPRVVRQVKERVRQHSLLSIDALRGQAISFDHTDFQDFYLGEGLGQLLFRASRPELQTFLSVNVIPTATIEQSVQYLVRKSADARRALAIILDINSSEAGFSFCKENCGALALRLVEVLGRQGGDVMSLQGMQLSAGSLCGRVLVGVTFDGCSFQPTSTALSRFEDVTFRGCQFERLEFELESGLRGCRFEDCSVESLRLSDRDEQTFDPAVITAWLAAAGAVDEPAGAQLPAPEDELLKVVEKFLRAFLRSTHIDESFIRLRRGTIQAPQFFDEVLPRLLDEGVLEEVPWKGQGVQHRYKLAVPMSDVSAALEQSQGTFNGFLAQIAALRQD
jgi:uncharacterized protein YjbI with pentapeptide repeats